MKTYIFTLNGSEVIVKASNENDAWLKLKDIVGRNYFHYKLTGGQG